MRSYLLIVGLVFFVKTAFGQSNFGIKMGANYATLSSDSLEMSYKPGFVGGIYWFRTLTDAAKLEGNLLYSQQGGKSDISTFKYNYLAFPLMVRFQNIESFDWHIGLQAEFLAGAKRDSIDVGTQVQPLDLLILAGINFQIIPKVELCLRYQYGFLNTSNSPVSNDFLGNRFFSFTLGYFFEK